MICGALCLSVPVLISAPSTGPLRFLQPDAKQVDRVEEDQNVRSEVDNGGLDRPDQSGSAAVILSTCTTPTLTMRFSLDHGLGQWVKTHGAGASSTGRETTPFRYRRMTATPMMRRTSIQCSRLMSLRKLLDGGIQGWEEVSHPTDGNGLLSDSSRLCWLRSE